MNARLALLGFLTIALQCMLLEAQPPAGAQRSKASNQTAARPLAERTAPERSAGVQTASPAAAEPSASLPGRTVPAQVAKGPAVQPDPAGRMVTLEVLVAEMNAPLAQPSAAAILELEKSGQLAGQMRLRLTAVENQSARLQLGETVPRVVGRASRPEGGFRGGPGFATYSDVQVGTVVQAVSRIEADGTVVAELKLDRSSLAAPHAAAVSNQPVSNQPLADEPPQVVAQLSLQATVRLKPGEAVIVGGREAKTAEQSSQTWVVLTAQVPVTAPPPGVIPPAAPLGQLTPPASAPAPAPISELKVFTLKHASAPDLAPVLTNVFAGQPVRFSVDPRTNSLLVIGPASSLQSAQALVTRLDGN